MDNKIGNILFLIIGILVTYGAIRIFPFFAIEIIIVAVIVLVIWLLKVLPSSEVRKERNAKIKFRADNLCPVCEGKGKLNGKDKFLNVTFNNEECYACDGIGYAKEVEKQQKFKEIKDYNEVLATCNSQIARHKKNMQRLKKELERGVMSNYEEKRAATETVINKHSERIQFYYELTENIMMNKTMAYYNLYDQNFSEMLNESIDTFDDTLIEEDTVKSIYYSERNQLDNSNLDRINSLLAYLNDKQEISEGFKEEIAQLTLKTKQKLNLYNKNTKD